MAVTDPDPAALLGHVIVLDRMAQHRVHHPSSLDPGKQPDAELGKRAYLPAEGEPFQGDAMHVGGELFAAVPHACACGLPLSREPLATLRRWAAHAAAESGLPADLLMDHCVVRIGVTRPQGVSTPRSTAFCACGKVFRARADDPGDPGQALAFWLGHLKAVA